MEERKIGKGREREGKGRKGECGRGNIAGEGGRDMVKDRKGGLRGGENMKGGI